MSEDNLTWLRFEEWEGCGEDNLAWLRFEE